MQYICGSFLLEFKHHLLSSFSIVLAKLIEQLEPIEEARILLQCCLVVFNINYIVFIGIHFFEYLTKALTVHLGVASGNDTEMRNKLGYDFFEFLEIEVACIVHIKEGETKLMLLVLVTIQESVHNGCKLHKVYLVILIIVDDLEYSIREKRIRLKSQKTHAGAKLLLRHFLNIVYT